MRTGTLPDPRGRESYPMRTGTLPDPRGRERYPMRTGTLSREDGNASRVCRPCALWLSGSPGLVIFRSVLVRRVRNEDSVSSHSARGGSTESCFAIGRDSRAARVRTYPQQYPTGRPCPPRADLVWTQGEHGHQFRTCRCVAFLPAQTSTDLHIPPQTPTDLHRPPQQSAALRPARNAMAFARYQSLHSNTMRGVGLVISVINLFISLLLPASATTSTFIRQLAPCAQLQILFLFGFPDLN